VKRELYQVRVLPVAFSVLLVVWALLVVTPARTPAQSPSPTPAPSESRPDKPQPDKTQDDAKAQSPEAERDAKAQEQKQAEPQDVPQAVKDDVKKNTAGTKLKPLQGLKLDVDLALVNVTVTDPYNRCRPRLVQDSRRQRDRPGFAFAGCYGSDNG